MRQGDRVHWTNRHDRTLYGRLRLFVGGGESARALLPDVPSRHVLDVIRFDRWAVDSEDGTLWLVKASELFPVSAVRQADRSAGRLLRRVD